MNKYSVQITETLQKIIDVESENLEKALSDIQNRYASCEIVLDASDYVETNIEVL